MRRRSTLDRIVEEREVDDLVVTVRVAVDRVAEQMARAPRRADPAAVET